jgi:hypothetical protein
MAKALELYATIGMQFAGGKSHLSVWAEIFD